MPYRRVRERPSRLCRGTHAMPLALYAALAHINKGARLFLAFCDWTPSSMDQSGEFSFSCRYTDKKIKFSSYIGKFRLEQLQIHIWLTASSYMGKYLRISSYIRKSFLIYVWLATAPLWISLYMRKFDFLFYQCTLLLHSAVLKYVQVIRSGRRTQR
jgi:hypothetical protein